MLGSNYTFLVTVRYPGREIARRLQALARRTAAVGFSREHPGAARGGRVPGERGAGLSLCALHRAAAMTSRSTGRARCSSTSTTIPSITTSISAKRTSAPAARGALRPAGQQRRPQGQPCADREGHAQAVGDRPRPVLPRGREAAHRAVGLCRVRPSPTILLACLAVGAGAAGGRRAAATAICGPYLAAGEIAAMAARAERLLESGIFPSPPRTPAGVSLSSDLGDRHASQTCLDRLRQRRPRPGPPAAAQAGAAGRPSTASRSRSPALPPAGTDLPRIPPGLTSRRRSRWWKSGNSVVRALPRNRVRDSLSVIRGVAGGCDVRELPGESRHGPAGAGSRAARRCKPACMPSPPTRAPWSTAIGN